jgi:hypothetical protein
MKQAPQASNLFVFHLRLYAFICGCLFLSRPGAAQTLWIAPPGVENGKALRSLFEHPDQWQQARSRVDVLFYTDLNFNKQFTDNDLRSWFSQLRQWKIKLAMEVGAVKEWAPNGEDCFAKERPMWERIQRLGGNLFAVALDEPLVCVRQHLKKPDAYAVEETANYIAKVREAYPQLQIGEIEAYPSTPLADHIWWIESLNAALAKRNVHGLDFYRLDVNWVVFNVRADTGKAGNWQEVKKLEQYCRVKKLPFSLIYWPADYPALKRQGLGDDETWYTSVMHQGYDYFMVGGKPDQYVIESWVGAPTQAVPDSSDFTFTRTVRDFAQKFLKSPH